MEDIGIDSSDTDEATRDSEVYIRAQSGVQRIRRVHNMGPRGQNLHRWDTGESMVRKIRRGRKRDMMMKKRGRRY